MTGSWLGATGPWLLDLGNLKPLLTALVLPPTGPLLLLLAGLWLMHRRRPRVSWRARTCVAMAVLGLWALSCQRTAIWLENHLLPVLSPVQPAQLAAAQVQAVVVLGGGIEANAPEYGSTQLNALSMERLRYGIWLSKQLQVPIAFAGGIGWGNAAPAGQPALPAEATIAARVAHEVYGMPIGLLESQSRDTRENGALMAPLLLKGGLTRIALVTHAWHMPRAMAAFAHKGLEVVPAPMGFTSGYERPALDALPSGHGMAASRRILREWLGLQLGR